LMVCLGAAGWILVFLAIVTNVGIWRIVGMTEVVAMVGAYWWEAKQEKKGLLKPKFNDLEGFLWFVGIASILAGVYGGPHAHRVIGSIGILCSFAERPVSKYTKKYILARGKREG
nr:hypothetical protein [Armatimonadota bacterium]